MVWECHLSLLSILVICDQIHADERCHQKTLFCICENKDADQLHCNCAANQALCFRYIDSTIIRNFQPLAIFCSRTARFVSDLIGNTDNRFSRDVAEIMLLADIDVYLPNNRALNTKLEIVFHFK